MNLKLKHLNSLVKVFADEEPVDNLDTGRLTGFKNETISFQVAYAPQNLNWNSFARVELDSPIKENIRLRNVELVPVDFATFPDADDNYLRKDPGLFPDLLRDLPKDGIIRIRCNQWRSIWIDVESSSEMASGIYPIKVIFKDLEDEIIAQCKTEVEILDAILTKQELRHTKWFHSDCLAEYYHVPVFSQRHWEIIESFISLAAKRGINMILTPTFTPPLDTAVGTDRLTVQLVDVYIDEGKYSFGFDKLKRWVQMCKRCGIEYFEMSHLFTQWGAKFAPKIMATVDGAYKKIFGWETSATGDEYKEFLGEYLSQLTEELKEWGIGDKTYFHISDEPSLDHLEDYVAAKEIVAPYLQGFEIIDALSDFEFYNKGALTKPIPANDHIHTFIDGGVEGLWTYYCIGQYKDVSNMFMSMPSARNRIFGVQLYKYDIEGILQWGYNFYKTQYSLENINPYFVTDGDGFTPSGDAFQVYPGEDGQPEESTRMMVTMQALYDLRAFKMLESLTSKDFVMELIEGQLASPITFYSYPKTDAYLLNLRARVNREIMKRIDK